MQVNNPQLEKQLLGRLKILGCILLVFSVGALFYNMIFDSSDEVEILEKEIAEELEDPPEPLNPFFVSTVFTIVGTGLLVISWKKKKKLFSSSPENKDPQ
ncbi:MAG TPA: hypothetical protein VHK67_00120 [Rhabdochlamydiaceae bacterium]|jgi:hypothetical protein|nr:hypothetical protein [Rhabdochlamydiaceae bacterium]